VPHKVVNRSSRPWLERSTTCRNGIVKNGNGLEANEHPVSYKIQPEYEPKINIANVMHACVQVPGSLSPFQHDFLASLRSRSNSSNSSTVELSSYRRPSRNVALEGKGGKEIYSISRSSQLRLGYQLMIMVHSSDRPDDGSSCMGTFSIDL